MTLGSDWTLAGSIMTFAIPVGGFIIAAVLLYWLYTKPHTVPGHRELVPAGAGAGGVGRHAAPPPSSAPPAGGTPDAGGPGRHEGMEGRE